MNKEKSREFLDALFVNLYYLIEERLYYILEGYEIHDLYRSIISIASMNVIDSPGENDIYFKDKYGEIKRIRKNLSYKYDKLVEFGLIREIGDDVYEVMDVTNDNVIKNIYEIWQK